MSKAARTTTVPRDSGENLSSWTYQASLYGKVARRYQKACRLVLQEYCQGVFRTDAFGEGDVRTNDADGNGRDSGRALRQDVFSIPDAWYSGNVEGKCANVYSPRKLRGIPLRGCSAQG